MVVVLEIPFSFPKAKMSQRGQFFASLVNYCVYYKNKWLSRGYTTPIMDAFLFAKIRRAVFGDNLRLINVATARTKCCKAMAPPRCVRLLCSFNGLASVPAWVTAHSTLTSCWKAGQRGVTPPMTKLGPPVR